MGVLSFIFGNNEIIDEPSSSSSSSYRERPKHYRYQAYCKLCGGVNNKGNFYNTPGEAIEALQRLHYGCGEKNHLPEVQKFER